MTAKVLKFPTPTYRGTQPPARKSPDSARYFCLSCQTDLFRNYADGKVHCGNCGAQIRNIEVLQLV